MRLINRYIANAVAGSIFIVLLVILSLDVISELVDELDKVHGAYTFSEVIVYSLLSIPASIGEFLPMSSLVGCLIGLGMMAASSELVVIRSAGVSVGRIIWAVMRPVAVIIIAGLGLSEFVTPLTSQYAESRRAIALGHQTALQKQRGVWSREGNEYMHFSAVLPNGQLFGVTRLKFNKDGELMSSTYIDSAIYQKDHWFEEGVVETVFEKGAIRKEEHLTRRWYSELSPKLLDVIALDSDKLPMRRLYTYADYREKQGLDAQDYRLSFWKKALQPLATASLVVIAISFIFGPLRSVTMGFRIFSGVIVGIVFRTSQDLLGPSSLIWGFSPMFAVLIPIAVCFLIGLMLLKRSA